MRGQIADIILCKGKPDDYGSSLDRADQILALLEPQMLTPEEARELLHCWKNESASRYGKVNRQAPLYLKLKKIVEGQ